MAEMVDRVGARDAAEVATGRGLSRRGFLTALGVAGVAAGGGLSLAGCDSSSGAAAQPGAAIDPYGDHQTGIATPAQDRLVFAAFDVTSKRRADLVAMLEAWSKAIPVMMAGKPLADVESNPQLPPEDTGEAEGLAAANLTVTVGFGPSLFDGRFGLASRRPAALAPIPPLPGDNLNVLISNGDLCVQACADDPQVAFHAVRNLRRIAQGTAVLRWTQLGFGKTSSTSTAQATPRNLMGFKDGTNNIKGEQSTVLDKQVWVGTETDQQWMRGGSYLVTRRIAMRLEAWDRDFLADQEKTFGRVKDTGAPLGEKGEFDTVPLAAKNPDGTLVIDQDAHIRLASPETNGGHKLLRRGYSYIDGVIAETGQLDAGLFFIVFQQDPRRQFVPIQRKLGSSDLLNEYIQHTSSALFACPPGFRQGEMIGAALFA